jgi:3-deoxy-D-manno-octulosonic-acid transferase
VTGAAYHALTRAAEIALWPWAAAARARGGDAAARWGDGDARGATWIHAASVGEVVAAAPLVRAIGAHRPADERLVTAGTASGLAAWRRELERRPPGGAPVAVTAWPIDAPSAVARALKRRRPRRVLIVETEIWPNFLAAAFERGVRVAFANARLSERKWGRTRWLAPALRPLLARVSGCAAQSEEDAARWAELGVPRDALCVTGNTKYDQLPPAPDATERSTARSRAGAPKSARIVVWGSLRPGEEDAFARLAQATSEWPDAITVAVPRHPDTALASRDRASRRLWGAIEDWAPGRPWPKSRAVWVPALGVLRDLYALADAAVVGGTFAPYEGHNAAEPAQAGLPVVVGPHHANVRDVVTTLVARDAGYVAADGVAAAGALAAWWRDDAALERARASARQAVENLGGATARTIGFLAARGFWG